MESLTRKFLLFNDTELVDYIINKLTPERFEQQKEYIEPFLSKWVDKLLDLSAKSVGGSAEAVVYLGELTKFRADLFREPVYEYRLVDSVFRELKECNSETKSAFLDLYTVEDLFEKHASSSPHSFAYAIKHRDYLSHFPQMIQFILDRPKHDKRIYYSYELSSTIRCCLDIELKDSELFNLSYALLLKNDNLLEDPLPSRLIRRLSPIMSDSEIKKNLNAIALLETDAVSYWTNCVIKKNPVLEDTSLRIEF